MSRAVPFLARRCRLATRYALAACAIALTGGCFMVGPDYQRPEVVAPAAFAHETAAAAATADTTWWQQFQDPLLDQLILEGLAHNSDIAIAAANVDNLSAVLLQTRSQLFPQTGYNAGGQGQRGDVPTTVYNATLSASWELDLWGRIRRQSESAFANVLASDEARRGVVLSLVATVANGYLQLCGLDAQLAIAQRTLGTYKDSVALFTLQFQYGQVSQMNVVQAQSQYETAAGQIPAIRSQIAQIENSLAVLVGREPGPITRGKSINELILPPIPQGVPSELLERRPDLLQSEQQLIAANAQIGAAKALYFPKISLTGVFGTASSDLTELFKGPTRVWTYAGSLAGPIFTFGAISGQVAQAEAAQKAALLNYQLAIRNAFADVDNALVANQQLQLQLGAQVRLVAALKKYTDLANLQFIGGYTDYTTVLQAEQSLFPAELALASLRAELLSSSVNTYKAMGGGWVTQADKLTTPEPQSPPTVAARPPLF
ncbi:MAG: efflux transporter outer membrane subunit [Gammaproteobacteria bacterium]|nr:efflux transporter outer membrane subunit [Gammaproteobacteria bacterium]